MKKYTLCYWRHLVSATFITSGLCACGGESPSSAPELGSTTHSAESPSVSINQSHLISTAYAAGTTINGAAVSSDIAAAQAVAHDTVLPAQVPVEPPITSPQSSGSTSPGNGSELHVSLISSPLETAQLPEPQAQTELITVAVPEPNLLAAISSAEQQAVETGHPPQTIVGAESGVQIDPQLAAEPAAEPDSAPLTGQTSESAMVTPSADTSSLPQPVLTQETSNPEISTQTTSNTGIEPRSISIGNHAGDVTKILNQLSVSTSQLMVQQTPIDTQHGYVYTANIEHGDSGDLNGTNLHTIVRKGIQNSDGSWSWTSALVENRTVHNQWHTAPSVVADKDGYVHVAYNMHNYPWQYKRSTLPHDLSDFEFLGQPITQTEIDRSKFENKTSFPTLGHARIPGNQITYPAFYKDRHRDVYATYRFAAKPKRSFPDRTMSGGVAAYDTQQKSWRAIGGPVPVNEGVDFTTHSAAPTVPTSLASDTGWTVYHPRLMFGPANDLHVNWFFRQGIAGAELSRPCYIKSQDTYSFTDASGSAVMLPMNSDDCGNVGYPDSQNFYSIGNSVMDSTGKPYIVLSPIGSSRQIVSYDSYDNRWSRENSPNNATEIFFDGDDNLWAVASGIRIMVKLNGSNSWNTVYADPNGGACFPKVTVNETGNTAFIHTHACDQKSITVYGVRLN